MSAPESSLSPETNDDLPPNHESPLIYSDLVESKPGQCKLCSFCNSNEGCSPIMARLFLENSRETKSKIMKDKIFELLWGCKSKEEKKFSTRDMATRHCTSAYVIFMIFRKRLMVQQVKYVVSVASLERERRNDAMVKTTWNPIR